MESSETKSMIKKHTNETTTSFLMNDIGLYNVYLLINEHDQWMWTRIRKMDGRRGEENMHISIHFKMDVIFGQITHKLNDERREPNVPRENRSAMSQSIEQLESRQFHKIVCYRIIYYYVNM